MVLFRVLCAVRIDFEPAGGSIAALTWPKQHLWRLQKDDNQLSMKATFIRRYEGMVSGLGGDAKIVPAKENFD